MIPENVLKLTAWDAATAPALCVARAAAARNELPAAAAWPVH